ncbi:Protease PrtS [bioreactor metagenome]|uniref:Protease PrtS n=1 Tax=bioreactor metagenome TaxID=1076179 RepID=A0A645C6G8_9ZZZZ
MLVGGVRAGEPEPRRAIHDAQGTTTLPGYLVRDEGGKVSADVAVDEAYDHLGSTWQLFFHEYGRDSLDGKGQTMVGTVHYGRNYDNAFWNGSQMVFGDGDGVVFNRFTIAVDVVAHELTHGVIESIGGLAYENQSGALNESLCDVFGSLVKQYTRGQSTSQADWLLGDLLLKEGLNAKALRSLSAPGTAYDDPQLGHDPQPAHMKDFVHTVQDNGGVHINSGIPNRAFYLLATALGGHAWEVAGKIWYEAMCSPQRRPTDNFAAFAKLTLAAARGIGAPELHAAQQSWLGVGVIPND